MITEKVLGAYTIVGTLSPTEQANWYRKAVEEWNISTFEVPILAGVPLVPEVVDVFTELSASLVVTLVAQWATVGQKNPAYGLSSLDESSRQAAIVDACSSLQQCATLSEGGVHIRNVFVHTGGRSGETIPHAIAFHQSLIHLREPAAAILPDTTLAVEVTDSLPSDHPIPFPCSQEGFIDVIRSYPNPILRKPRGCIRASHRTHGELGTPSGQRRRTAVEPTPDSGFGCAAVRCDFVRSRSLRGWIHGLPQFAPRSPERLY